MSIAIGVQDAIGYAESIGYVEGKVFNSKLRVIMGGYGYQLWTRVNSQYFENGQIPMNSGYSPFQFQNKNSRQPWLEYGRPRPGLGARRRSATVR